MAGCLPEYMPLVVEIVRAHLTEGYNAHAVTGTLSGAADVSIVNGPIRHAIGINCGDGLFGPGHGCAVRDRDGDWWFVYHQKRTARREWGRFICLDRLHFDEQGRLYGEATRNCPQPAPAAR